MSQGEPAGEHRLSTTVRARTITHVCSSGTLSTLQGTDDGRGVPFGSHADYILDDKGWPVMLLSQYAVHSKNIAERPEASLFCQLPKAQSFQQAAALSRVSITGRIVRVEQEELLTLGLAFSLVHSYAEQLLDNEQFFMVKLQPERIYFSGGFGVQAQWLDVPAYEEAKPDVLAAEVPTLLPRLNVDRQEDLYLLCRHFLNLSDVDFVRIMAVDSLGVDLRVQQGAETDEWRIAFRNAVVSPEDAKSEVTKLFQEAWEVSQGFHLYDEPPKVTRYASDILGSRKRSP